MRKRLAGLAKVIIGCLSIIGIVPVAASAADEAEVQPLTVTPYDEGLWLHTSYQTYNGYQVPSHGMIVEGDEAVIVIDTGWSEQNTDDLLAWIEAELAKPVSHLVITHAHADKMSGVEAFQAVGADIHAHMLTAADGRERGFAVIEPTFDVAETIAIPGAAIEAFYPGPGHTRDNVVVKIAGTDVLYGGCFIRPGLASGTGNTADADVAVWPHSVRAVQARYPQVSRVIPSHGAPGSRALLDQTIAIFEPDAAEPARR